ncbi:MAG: VOC family protein [Frankiaceae bacterium]|nr:VOC family protein [Frankiaceae bacterium]
MASSIVNIVMDCENPWELAQFWSMVLDRPVHPDNEPSDEIVGIVIDPQTGGELEFQRVAERKITKNRQHICLWPDDRSRDEEVDRLLAAGAALVQDHRQPDGLGWVVLADPAGNEFCILRSQAERAATD